MLVAIVEEMISPSLYYFSTKISLPVVFSVVCHETTQHFYLNNSELKEKKIGENFEEIPSILEAMTYSYSICIHELAPKSVWDPF